MDTKLDQEQHVIQSREWMATEIKPLSVADVDQLMHRFYKDVLELRDTAYGATRGVGMLLSDSGSTDYAKLPQIEGRSAKYIFESMKPGDEWLDLGCGSGKFLNEVGSVVNPGLIRVGFDARTWKQQEQLDELVLGDIDRLDASLFPNHKQGFDLITSAAVFYHLPDFLNPLARAIRLLKTNGILLVSTINRPRIGENPIDDENGNFTADPKEGAMYYKNRNLFKANGNLLSFSEAVSLINIVNPGIKLEYHTLGRKHVVNGILNYGGGISVRRIDSRPLNFSNIFYCYYPKEKDSEEIGYRDISFILAKDKSEVEQLRKEGYSSVQDRL